MSYFSARLQALLEERTALTQVSLARAAEMSQGLVSAYINADQRPNFKTLDRLCRAVEPADAVSLLIAFLRDEIPRSMEGTIEIKPADPTLSVSETPAGPVQYRRLPRRVRDLIDAIAEESERRPDLVTALTSTLDLIRGK